MTVVNPVGYLHNVSTHSALVDRLASAGGVLLPATTGELRARGGVRMPGDMLVTAQATPNMSVNVAAGIAYVPGPTAVAGTYSLPNDAPWTVAIGTAHATLPRNDLIVARVADSFYAGTGNQGEIVVVPGIANATPADPPLPAGYSYLILARVVVRANTASILSTDITNLPPQVRVAGNVPTVSGNDNTPGLYDGAYRDHPTKGLQRWINGTWTTWPPVPRRFESISASASWASPGPNQIATSIVIDPTALFGPGIAARVILDGIALVDIVSGGALDWYYSIYRSDGQLLAQDYNPMTARKIYSASYTADVPAGGSYGFYPALYAPGAAASAQVVKTYADFTSNRLVANVFPLL